MRLLYLSLVLCDSRSLSLLQVARPAGRGTAALVERGVEGQSIRVRDAQGGGWARGLRDEVGTEHEERVSGGSAAWRHEVGTIGRKPSAVNI